jgi:hypothetical protein
MVGFDLVPVCGVKAMLSSQSRWILTLYFKKVILI